jgi:hypothetical protein
VADPLLIDLARCAPALLAGFVRGLVQSPDPYDRYYNDFGDPYAVPDSEPMPIGALIIGALVGIGINFMFALWGKSRAESYNVDPWIGFALGFVLGLIGIGIIPVFRRDRLFNKQRHAAPLQPSAPNPIYAPIQQGAYMPPPPPGYVPPPAAYLMPQPQGGYAAPAAYGAPPQMPPPMPPPPPSMLTADAGGYVACPACAARTKSGRKTCMSCGYTLPPVYDPNIR